jgi:hypothetical protein
MAVTSAPVATPAAPLASPTHMYNPTWQSERGL